MFEWFLAGCAIFGCIQLYEIARQLVSIHKILQYRFRVEMPVPHTLFDAYRCRDPKDVIKSYEIHRQFERPDLE